MRESGNVDEWEKGSLIPRWFPPPVFDCLQYTNMEGKAWEIRLHQADTRGRREGGQQ